MIGGNIRTKVGKITTTQTAVLTAGKERPAIIGIYLSNQTASAATAIVDVTRSSVDYSLLKDVSIDAKGYVHVKAEYGPLFILEDGDALKVDSGTTDAIHYIITYSEIGAVMTG